MTAMKLPTYSLQLRGARFYDVYFRVNGRQVKRRVGRAWVKDGKPRRGRPQEGFLDVAAAHDRAREIVAEHVATVAEPRSVGPTFRNVAREYMTWLAKVRGAKPSTLAGHGYALAEPNGTTNGSVMRALGDRPAAEVTAAEIEALLDTLAESGARARTINKRRALLLAVFNYGMRRCGLPGNPVRGTDTRRGPRRSSDFTPAATSLRARSSCSAIGADARSIRARSSRGSRARATPPACARSGFTICVTPTAACSRLPASP